MGQEIEENHLYRDTILWEEREEGQRENDDRDFVV